MNVTLNVDQEIMAWNDQPIIVDLGEGTQEPMTLRFVLLGYTALAGQLGMSVQEQFNVYDAGRKIARGGDATLSESEWEALKKLCIGAVERNADLPLPAKVQAKRLVDGARPEPQEG